MFLQLVVVVVDQLCDPFTLQRLKLNVSCHYMSMGFVAF